MTQKPPPKTLIQEIEERSRDFHIPPDADVIAGIKAESDMLARCAQTMMKPPDRPPRRKKTVDTVRRMCYNDAGHEARKEPRKMDDFSTRQISVTLSGEQWFAVIAAMLDKPLSAKGRQALREAKTLLAFQLGEAGTSGIAIK